METSHITLIYSQWSKGKYGNFNVTHTQEDQL